MDYIKLQYSNYGILMQGIYNGQYLSKNQIAQVIFDKLQGNNLPLELNSPENIEMRIANFSEGWLKSIRSILQNKGINFTVTGDSYQYNLREDKMTQEQLRMQMLSGVITESEYKTKLEELNAAESKDSLNEHYIAGGIVGVGAITQIPSREKTDYEMAFEHFLGERYLTKFENREQDLEEDLNEGVLAVAGGVILGILGLRTLLRITKGISAGVSLAKMTDPKKLKEAVAEIGKEAMQKGKNPLQVALWMSTVNSMIESGEIKNGISLAKTWGNIDKIDIEKAFSSSESEGVEEGKEVEEPENY
jgi:hypothetical protein